MVVWLNALALALFAPVATAQENPVEKVVTEANWQTKQVAAGVAWRAHHFQRLLGTSQFISVLQVDLDAPGVSVDVVRPDSGRMTTSELARRTGAIAAVNGSYFESDGTPALFLQDEGSVIRPDDDGEIRIWEDGAVITETDGDAAILRRSLSVWRAMPGLSDVLVAGPLLVWDGAAVEAKPVSFNLTHHPRTAAGLTADNKLMLVTVDGRNVESAGLTIPELALVMQALGCEYALNLDGGGSTTMWTESDGVVNHPSDNKLFDHAGERTVANAVVVRVE